MLDAAVYAYPWDVVGDPAAPEVLAGLGADHVSVAAVYHATRTLTPRHPGHRVVVAEHSAAYFPIDGMPSATWMRDDDSFGASAAALASAGVATHAWVVVNHVDPAAKDHSLAMVNAFGDRYPWALCASKPAVLDRAVGLARAVALRADVAGIEFEAAGWYGFDHLHEHDKVSGIALDTAAQRLMSLCFCDECRAVYRDSGLDDARLRDATRSALAGTFASSERDGGTGREDDREGETVREDGLEAGTGREDDLFAAAAAVRATVAEELRAAMVEEVRKHRPDHAYPIVFHGSPDTTGSTAFTGIDAASLPAGATGMVVNAWHNAENVTAAASAASSASSASPATSPEPEPARIYASILGVQGMGATPERASALIAASHAAGASGIRIYHAGLAAASDLAMIRDLVTLAHSR